VELEFSGAFGKRLATNMQLLEHGKH